MKINKLFLMAGLFVMALMAASCSSDDDDYTPGKAAGNNNVVFINEANQVLALTDKQFTIELKRDNTNGDLTVPLQILNCSSMLTCPTEAKFASGSDKATIIVGISDEAKAFEEYMLSVRIPEDYTNPYIQQEGVPQLNVTVLKEDYKVVQRGTYISWWTEEEEDAELEYSEFLDTYRFKNQTSGKFTFGFKLGDIITDESSDYVGTYPITFDAGFVSSGCVTAWSHSTYGVVTMRGYTAKKSIYDPESKTYYFDIRWLVSAGSFGDFYDTFTVK